LWLIGAMNSSFASGTSKWADELRSTYPETFLNFPYEALLDTIQDVRKNRLETLEGITVEQLKESIDKEHAEKWRLLQAQRILDLFEEETGLKLKSEKKAVETWARSDRGKYVWKTKGKVLAG
jgi:hypothetical protein